MTIIGKILTFLVFFLSLVFLGFAYNINQLNKDPKSNQSWYQVVLNKQKVINDMQADLDAKDAERIRVKRELVGAQAKAKSDEENAKKLVKTAEEERDTAKTESAKAKTDFENSQVALKAATDELNQRRAEATTLYTSLKNREIAINDLTAKVTDANNKRVQQEVAANTYLQRLQAIERQYQDLAREFEKMQDVTLTGVGAKGAETAAGPSRPPPEDVKGTVTKVTPDGLVAISIGSDAGLLRGHTLEVFRTEPKALYLGRIKIVEVGPHEAVGQIMSPQFKKMIQAQDQVASRIVPR